MDGVLKEIHYNPDWYSESVDDFKKSFKDLENLDFFLY